MKRKVIFSYLKSSIFLILTIFLSCNDDYMEYDVQIEKLDKVGKAFMGHLLSSSDGKQQWKKLTSLGDIPPNEVALVFQGNRAWQYILPLLKDSMLIGMVSLPIEIGENNKNLSECSIGAPLVLEKEEIKSDIFMQGILKSSISRKWRENGIIIDENLIVNLANSTLFSPLSRGSGGCFYASYTLEANNYLDDEGFAIINGINTGTFSEIANKVAREVHRALEITVEEDIIFVIAPTEGIAVIYYMQLASYLYGIALKRKKRVLHHVSTLSDSWHWETVNELLSLSLPMTGSRLIGSLTSFLEPMCLVLFAGVLLQQQLITTYGQLNGYVMPLLTLPSFATIALSNWLLPSFTYQASRHRMDHARKQFFQIGLCCLGIGCASGLTLFCFAEPICQLLYHQTQMVGLLRSLALPFILYSIQPCLSSVLHALGQSQKAMIDTTCGCLTRLACISFLTIPLGTQAVGIALVSGMLVTTVLHLGRVLRCLFQDEKAILLPQA